MKNLGLSLIVVALLCIGIMAQTEEQSGLIKTDTGILVVNNEPGNYFTIEINGKTVKPVADHPLWFTIDGKFVQIVTPAISEFITQPADKRPDDKSLLSAHLKWETDYLADTLGSKLTLQTDWIKLDGDRQGLSWAFDMPKVDPRQTAKKQLYLTVVKRDHVFGLNTVVETDGEEAGLKQLLLTTMKTLKSDDKPLNLEKARDMVMKRNALSIYRPSN